MRRATSIIACLVVALWSDASRAEAIRAPEVSCRVLLPATAIPNDPGHRISIQQLTITPGHDGHRHVHGMMEYMVVLSGSGRLSMEGHPDLVLTPGVAVEIPMNVPHQQHNASETDALVFTATFVQARAAQSITEYVGEPDTLHGCPHHAK